MAANSVEHGLKKIFFILVCLLSSPLLAKQVISHSSLVSVAVPVAGGLYSLTIEDYEGAKELLFSCLFTAQLTTLLKYTVRRTRPNGENDLSFPSGHASASFTGASYLHHRYGLNWGIPMYAIAAGIGIQRVNVRDHYWTDVLAGAALGYLSGALFTAKYPNVWVVPSVDLQNDRYAIHFQKKF